MIIDVLEYLQTLLNPIARTFIHTPHKNASNIKEPWIVLTSPYAPTVQESFCNSLYQSTIQIYVVESELSDHNQLKNICERIEEILKITSHITNDDTRIYEIKNVSTQTGLFGLNNKENWIVTGVVYYGKVG